MKKLFLLAAIFFLCGCPRAKAQVPVTLNPYQRQQFFDVNGNPLNGGCVFTYSAGTSTPLATYTDYTGLYQNTNPVILDSSGEAVMWLSANAYRLVLYSNGGVNCASGTQQWTLDFVTPPPFLAGNNAWTGNETHSGTETFNAAVVLNSGGSLNGTISGSPNFSGNPTFSGNPSFSNNQSFPSGISTDTISGTFTSGGTFNITGANGTGGFAGEAVNRNGGNGSSTGGGGGNVIDTAGSAATANFAGGQVEQFGGAGMGTAAGGAISRTAGTGGSTAGTGGAIIDTAGTGGAGGNGGDIDELPGAAGAGGKTGSFVIGTSGRIKFQVNATSQAPTCGSSGIGGAGTCTLANYSSDSNGRIILTPAAGVAALGLITLTFNQSMGSLGSVCQFMLDQAGTGQWPTTSVIFGDAEGTFTATADWNTNGAALVAGSIYGIKYDCVGRQ